MSARPKVRPSAPASTPVDRSDHEMVDPGWLLRAAAAVVLVAAVCAYLTVCIVFWRTQWQLVLHPSRVVQQTPAAVSLAFEEVRFSPGSDGQPQLDGWWIPANTPSATPSAPVALLLHGESGNMADALPLAGALHKAQLSVLLFDYRGFGRSAGGPPSQFAMQQDAEAALSFVRDSRHVPLSSLIPVGDGLGASLAVRLAAGHREVPAVVLISATGDLEEQAKLATRSHLVPFTLLFHENFPLADALHQLATPKLIVAPGAGHPSVLAQRAADPKMTVELPAGDYAALEASLRRFLDTYVRARPGELRPSAGAP